MPLTSDAPERTQEYAALVSEHKRFKVYNAAPALNAEARRDQIEFLAEQLGFRSPEAEVISKLPDLPRLPVPGS